MGTAERENTLPPFSTFNFEVTLTLNQLPEGVSNPICDAAFSECSGLDMTMEPKTIANGGSNQHQSHRMGPVTYGRLTLKRGMTENLHIWNWFTAASTPGKDCTAEGEITMKNADGEDTVIYKLEECLPVKVSGPSLNAQNGQVAIEELQLVYARMTIELPDAPGAGFSASAGFEASASASIGGSAGFSASASASLSVSGGPGLSGGVSASADASATFGF
jgi:phage tail-like protein